MNNIEMWNLLSRIDERTKNIEDHMKEDRESNGKRLDAHALSIKHLEGHRNFLHGVWIAMSLVASWLGFGGHK
jgi:hypothetical protein